MRRPGAARLRSGLCPRCEEKQADRRDQRRAVAAALMLHASETERRTATAKQLHQDVTAQAWIREHRWAQVREPAPLRARALK
ncbi:hypothetical protein [Streptomyces sp. NPDC094049]|uniref:hypothetical protein n=1 Tax=Streptomyces sp. NPDC094049 TaxID=3154987 RepID=UPI003321A680